MGSPPLRALSSGTEIRPSRLTVLIENPPGDPEGPRGALASGGEDPCRQPLINPAADPAPSGAGALRQWFYANNGATHNGLRHCKNRSRYLDFRPDRRRHQWLNGSIRESMP